jgi:DNA-binding NarL/FixJ family response regulator
MATEPEMEIVGEAGNGKDAVWLAAEHAPDVVLMDIRMPGMGGIEATKRITRETAARVLVLTTFDEDENIYAALRAGASGFLVKDMQLEDIIAAVKVVAGGEALLAPSVTSRLISDIVGRAPAMENRPRRVPDDVTSRELEVLTLIGYGLSNQEIAGELTISMATVKAHVTRLLAKLQARDRVQLVIITYETGLVTTSG